MLAGDHPEDLIGVTSMREEGAQYERRARRPAADLATVGVFRIAGSKIAECWLVPFDQYLFDELWS
jgi:hypothetical protein